MAERGLSMLRAEASGATTGEDILRAAARLFRTQGFHASSLREVADAVGLSKAGLYHHFTSKSDILTAIAQRAIDVLMRDLLEIIHDDPPPVEALKRFVLGRIRLIVNERDVMAVFWQELPIIDQTLRSKMLDDLRVYRARVRMLVEKGQADGVIRDNIDPSMIVLGLDGITGWAHLWFSPLGRLSSDEIAEEFWKIAGSGIIAE